MLIALCVSLSVMGQETVMQKEIGLLFNNFDNFGIGFKTGTESAMWRFNTLLLNGGEFNDEFNGIKRVQNNFGFDLRAGREYRRDIAKNLEIRYGGDVHIGYQRNKAEQENDNDPDFINFRETITFVPGINFVFGFNYVINNSIVIGAEVLPGISYRTGKNRSQNNINEDEIEGDISGFSYGISNSSALLSLSCRF